MKQSPGLSVALRNSTKSDNGKNFTSTEFLLLARSSDNNNIEISVNVNILRNDQ